jgi:hypothetical protein
LEASSASSKVTWGGLMMERQEEPVCSRAGKGGFECGGMQMGVVMECAGEGPAVTDLECVRMCPHCHLQ